MKKFAKWIGLYIASLLAAYVIFCPVFVGDNSEEEKLLEMKLAQLKREIEQSSNNETTVEKEPIEPPIARSRKLRAIDLIGQLSIFILIGLPATIWVYYKELKKLLKASSFIIAAVLMIIFLLIGALVGIFI